MAAVAYLIGLCCALPLLGFAAGVLAVGHAVTAQSIVDLAAEAAVALVWGVPLALCAVLVLAGCGFSTRCRPVGASVVIVLNVAATIVVLRATGLPHTVAGVAMLGPTAVSCGLLSRTLFRQADQGPAQTTVRR